MANNHPFERGQALVVIAGALVAILAMVALAVDGSMVYSDRRNLQSAADNAAMSASSAAAVTMDTYAINHQTFECDDPGVIEAEIKAIDTAISRAGIYGFLIDTDISDNNGVQITCRITSNAGLVERYLDIAVKISHQTLTGFTRFIKPGGVTNTVEAVSRVQPRRSLAKGNAIASLGTDCGGVDMNGNGTIVIDGGGIFSNSCLDFRGNTDITINVSVGGIGYMTTYTEVGNVDINMTPEQSGEALEIVDIPTPDCLTQTDFGSLEVEDTMTINGLANSVRFHQSQRK